MNVNDWAPWVAIAVSVVSLLYAIIAGRSKDNDRRFADQQKQIDEKAAKDGVAVAVAKLDVLEDRVTRIETNMDHMPDHQMVTTLQGMIGKLTGDVAVLSERIRPIASIADRLQEKILEQAGFDR